MIHNKDKGPFKVILKIIYTEWVWHRDQQLASFLMVAETKSK